KPVDIDELWQLVKRLAHERRKELDAEREEQKEALTRWVMSQILSLPAPETGRKERYFRRVRGFWLCVSQLDAYAELERQLTETERKDRKSTRLNSSHVQISYAVFCLQTSTAASG